MTPTHPDARAALPTAGARYIAPSPSVVLGPPLVPLELHVEIQPVPHVDEPPAAAGGNRRAASAILERSVLATRAVDDARAEDARQQVPRRKHGGGLMFMRRLRTCEKSDRGPLVLGPLVARRLRR